MPYIYSEHYIPGTQQHGLRHQFARADRADETARFRGQDGTGLRRDNDSRTQRRNDAVLRIDRAAKTREMAPFETAGDAFVPAAWCVGC